MLYLFIGFLLHIEVSLYDSMSLYDTTPDQVVYLKAEQKKVYLKENEKR